MQKSKKYKGEEDFINKKLDEIGLVFFCFDLKNSECSLHLKLLLIFYFSQSKFENEIMKQLEESVMSDRMCPKQLQRRNNETT